MPWSSANNNPIVTMLHNFWTAPKHLWIELQRGSEIWPFKIWNHLKTGHFRVRCLNGNGQPFENWTKMSGVWMKCPVFKCHSKSGHCLPFENRHVRFSDPHCILLPKTVYDLHHSMVHQSFKAQIFLIQIWEEIYSDRKHLTTNGYLIWIYAELGHYRIWG